MENLFLPFFLGLLAGFFVSSGVGPLGITAITKSLEESFMSGFCVGIGVAVLDMVYSAIALFGLSSFFDYHFVKLAFQIIGIPLLIFLAIKSFRYHPVLNNTDKKLPKIKYQNSILIGISIYLANPTFLPLWVGIVGILHSRELLTLGYVENYFFIFGVGIGTLLWFYASLKIIKKWDLLAKPTIIKKVFFVSGIALSFFALYLLYKLIIGFMFAA
jgi:threonine/homoserine/homoserine lactone efflux protein